MKVIGEYIRKSYDELGNVEITVSIKNYNDKKAIDQLSKDTYSFEIKKPRSQRSINQNSLFWKMCSLIADETGEDMIDVYIHLLEDTNAKYEYIMGLETIEDQLRKNFRAVRVVRPELYNGQQMYIYKCFIGSSKFDVQEMNRLIDKAMSYCHELDIAIEDDYI